MKIPIKATKNKVTFSVRMTPLIDVIFLLLIFFILAIRIEKPEGVLENILPVSDGQSIAEQQKDWEVVKLRIKLI
ncbi:MAG: biopolymer transporter ExbD, partial [Deltaproteobacteria bacterium]|nr:biopolymer transporter ExbD [Deltaproteobacteria bacterium]